MSAQIEPLAWSLQSNIYEVNLRQYTNEGTFTGFAKALPRLKDMGAEILWFMPITPISVKKRLGSLGSYYACSDYTATNPEFGTVADFKELVRKAHELGLKVIIDWVANHTGWDHRWTKEHPEYYRKNADGNFFDANGWEDVIDLNYYNHALRKAMIESMRFWIDTCDIDGFRCDMAMLVPLDFWREARMELETQKKLFWFAECELPMYGEVFDASYTWKFLHAMEAYYRNEVNLASLLSILQEYEQNFAPGFIRVFFTTNHDENSHSGSELERLGDSAKAFSVLCCTWNGMPLIYTGQEIPVTRRLKFFEKDAIDWNVARTLESFFKTLLALRRRNKALSAGEGAKNTVKLKTNSDENLLAFIRKKDEAMVLVILNLSASKVTAKLQAAELKGNYLNVFSGGSVAISDGEYSEDLAAWDYRVLERK
ncbi:MAG: 1,4-alpha-glucan branching protein [Bacteroidetes bacterium]|nr:MAG: 1,4-alpha-glucan branching protein [Bacteroidota bacterium]